MVWTSGVTYVDDWVSACRGLVVRGDEGGDGVGRHAVC